ncbi:MAG: hypothetical protein WKF43_06760 [Acidimicrobiales bacterium]
MGDAVDEAVARRLWRTLEPVHGMVYFVPEGPEEYAAVGLKGARMGYFASRAAPMGPVPAEVVTATFYNFHPGVVHRAIPDAWVLASPADILAARLRVVDRALRRVWGDEVGSPSGRSGELPGPPRPAARPRVVRSTPAMPPCPGPTRPTVLWHAISLLREFRGDGHIAALVSAGIGPCPPCTCTARAASSPSTC